MKTKKRVVLLVACILLLSMLCAGCGDKSGKTKQVSGLDLGGETEELTLPISEDGLTLSMFIGLDRKVSAHSQSYNEVEFIKELEKRTGIHLEFQHATGTAVDEQFNLLLASGELPDLIMYKWLMESVNVDGIVNDGVILRLNDYINKYAPNYKKVLEENPLAAKELKLLDGSIPTFAMLQLEPMLRTSSGFMIRQDWLDRLGLQMPQTIDDWYTVLKAFKEQDANGNGDPNDEIPFSAGTSQQFVNFLGAYGIGSDEFYVKDGKMKYGPLEPEFEQYIRTMSKWYKEGLIDNEYLTVGQSNKMESDIGGATFGAVSGNLGKWTNVAKETVPGFNLVGAPWPMAEDGVRYSTGKAYVKQVNDSGIAISSNCEHIKEAVKWLDYLFTEEGTRLVQFGIEGESYEMVDGVPTFTDAVMNNKDGWTVDQAVAKYAFPHIGFPKIMSKHAYTQIQMGSEVQTKSVETWMDCDTSLLYSDLLMTPEEKAEFTSIKVQVDTFTDEMFSKLILGTEDFKNYDKVIDNIKKMGIERALEIAQTAYERFVNMK